MTKKGLKVLCGILFIGLAVAIALVIMEFATPYKPSNRFKKEVPEQEQVQALPDGWIAELNEGV